MPAIRAALYRELYQFFTSERHGLRPSTASGRDLPRPLARGLVHFYSLLRTATLDALDEDLADLVAGSVSEWFVALWSELEVAGNDLEPAGSSHGPDRVPGDEASMGELFAWYRARRPAGDPLVQRIERRIGAATIPQERTAIRSELRSAAARLRVEAWEISQERAIRLVITPLADHLNEVIPPIATSDARCREIFRRPGDWEIFGESWRDVSWRAIGEAHVILEADAEMQRLTESIVRGPLVAEERTVRRFESRAVHRREVYDRGFGYVTGITGRSGVELALPDELALLATPETENVFSRKLAEQGVLALSSDRVGIRESVHTVREWRDATVPVHPGPVVVCLDTSGSMQGVPEQVASAILLGLVRASVPYRRQIRILAVRGGLREVAIPSGDPADPIDSADQTSDLSVGGEATIPSVAGTSPSRVDENAIRALGHFLDRPTTAGSDIDPALDSALETIGSLDQMVADLVLISDMRFPRIGPLHRSRLGDLQRRGILRAHAITIGEKPMHDPLHAFDQLLHFNTGPDEHLRSAGPAGMIGFRHGEHLL